MSEETFGVPYAGWLVPFLLLNLRERDSDGHELRQRMADLRFGATHPWAMYRALGRMERVGMIPSESDGLDGRASSPRRRFSITGSGEAYLELWADALARYREEVDLLFATYAERPSFIQTKDVLSPVPPGPTRPGGGSRRPRRRSLRCAGDR